MTKSFTADQSYYFLASPEEVFNAIADPKVLVKWFLSNAKLVPKKGGDYAFDWIGGYHMTGKVKRFEPNIAVSYSWHDRLANGEMVETLASFELAKKAKGTLLRLRHTGFHDPEHFAECSSRWGYYLTNLKSVLDHGIDLRSKYDW
jgi:uncharacterized protein YndB with AHSA1/START domain